MTVANFGSLRYSTSMLLVRANGCMSIRLTGVAIDADAVSTGVVGVVELMVRHR